MTILLTVTNYKRYSTFLKVGHHLCASDCRIEDGKKKRLKRTCFLRFLLGVGGGQGTKIAYAQTRAYGMNETVGLVSFPEGDGSRESGRRPYSKRLAATIDNEARSLISRAYKRTERLLIEHRPMLETVTAL